MEKKFVYADMGSVSSGTMRLEDLIPCFMPLLREYARENTRTDHLQFLEEIGERMEDEGYYETEESDHDLDELFNALQEYALPYFYFGSHPGDGADYGYWLSEDFECDFDGKKISDLSELTEEDREQEVLHINDHGNMTLYWYDDKGNLEEIWAVV